MLLDSLGLLLGLLDGNRTHISRLGGACTIHYATRRTGRILARTRRPAASFVMHDDDPTAWLARRYTFLIDAQGKIAKTYLKVDTSKHSAEIIADLKTLSQPPGK